MNEYAFNYLLISIITIKLDYEKKTQFLDSLGFFLMHNQYIQYKSRGLWGLLNNARSIFLYVWQFIL